MAESGRDYDEITTLLNQGGDADSRGRLVALLYPELKRIADAHMARERPDHTLQATALVGEFFLKLMRQPGFQWKSRQHFFLAASRAMRRLLIDYARARNSGKRGNGNKVEFVDLDGPQVRSEAEFIEIDEALDRLAAEEPRMAQVVEMRVFGGLSVAEIAEALDIDERTVKRDWQLARAWLVGQLRKGPGGRCRQENGS